MDRQTLSANGTLTFVFENPCRLGFLLGPTGGTNFGGGAVAVSQDGIPYTGYTSVSSAARGEIEVRGGENVTFVLTGSTNPDLDVVVFVKERFSINRL